MCSRVRSPPPRRSSGVEVRLIARNNEVLATKTTGADGRVDFDPGLSRGTGGSAPGLLVATLGDDYGFLNLGQPAFDLTDRGVSGRDAPSALDAFLYTERGVYRSGETVFVAALLRDAKGEAKTGLPLTLVVKRPDGVEYKRAIVADQGLGGRAVAVPLLSDAAAGKWSIDAYADPKAPGDRPRRIPARRLCARAARLRAEDRQAGGDAGRADRRFARRALPLWRARRRPRRDRRDPPAGGRRTRRSPAIPAMSPA